MSLTTLEKAVLEEMLRKHGGGTEILMHVAAWRRTHQPREEGDEAEPSNKITEFIHCIECIEDLKGLPGQTPSSWARYGLGFTVRGIQIWCLRHDANVMHMDFEGYQHPTNTHRLKREDEKGGANGEGNHES